MENDLKSKKMYDVEFLRFIFAVIIVYYHIFHANINGLEALTPFIPKLTESCAYGSAVVECFFIISGYFLCRSVEKSSQLSVFEFAYNKFSRLWPVLAVHLIIGLKFFYYNPYDCLFASFFVQAVGLTPSVSGTLWYVSSLFYGLIFIFVLHKCIKNSQKFNLILAVITYFSYAIVIANNAVVFGRGNYYFFSIALLRAVGGIGLGYLICVFSKQFKNLKFVSDFKPNKFEKILVFISVSAVQIVCFYLLLRHFIDSQNSYKQQFYVVILFSVFFIMLLSRKGIFTLLFNNKFFGFLGKYSYSIYVMQQISFYILQKTLWKNSAYVSNHFLRLLALSLLFAVAFGILTYYVIEKPGKFVFDKLGDKLFSRNN